MTNIYTSYHVRILFYTPVFIVYSVTQYAIEHFAKLFFFSCLKTD